MDTPKFNAAQAEDLYAYLVETLGLANHTITFHIIEPAEEFGSGMITDWETLNDDEAFNEIADREYDEPFVRVDAVTTYQLGFGESESATSRELETLENLFTTSHEAFDAMLAEYADVLCQLTDANIANPSYDEDELTDEE